MISPQFCTLKQHVLDHEKGSDGELTVSYLRDVSALLALVSAVRECDIDRHLEAEREMVSLAFAFDHQNYARYCSYQHVYLQDLKGKLDPAYHDLKSRGHGGSISGGSFSTIHGDLITELFNKETKGTAGPFRAGFSTDIEATNTWVQTIHIHSMLRIALRNQLSIKTSGKHKEATKSGKKLHEEHVSNLKKTLKGYGVDPFSCDPPKCFSTGIEIDHLVVTDMLKASETGNEAFLTFVSERLVAGSKSFFAPIKRLKLNTGIVAKKKTIKAISVLKEDCQAFGLIVSKSLSLEEAFRFPITTFPLSIATPEGNLRQSDKASFRNFLIVQSKSSTNNVPLHAAWFIDGMAAVRSLKSKATYREWIKGLLKFLQPPDELKPCLVGMINDTYQQKSVKAGTRRDRGEAGLASKLEGFEQHMPKGLKWNEFLKNQGNKTELIKLITEYIITEEARSKLTQPFIVTNGCETLKVQHNGFELMYRCNHEEADTRLALHASLEESDVVIVSKDTDVLVLLVWTYSMCSPGKKWLFKYDQDKYADIGVICEFLGPDICQALPAMHAMTGCDTTSYFFKTGKVKVFKKLLNDPAKCKLLRYLGLDSDLKSDDINNLKEFIRTVIYNGKDNETYVETRIRLYKEMKSKSSLPVSPDPDSAEQAIRRANYQVFHWVRCHEINIEDISFENNGWKWDDELCCVTPVWFTGDQLPPSLNKAKKRKKKTVEEEDEDGDVEMTDTETDMPMPKRKSKTKLQSKNRLPQPETIYDGDTEMSTREAIETTDVSDLYTNSEWEVSDFSSSDESMDEWLP
ncbi:MAG: hypothetical protein CMB97_00015 [Flavobacteriaceae bacterium]|nr:hypothetical protein [Flavobacteriaceae bacterium]